MNRINWLLINILAVVLVLTGCQSISSQPESNQTSSIPNKTEDNNDYYPDVGFNFENRTVELNNGYSMPIIGIGTYNLS